MRFTLLFLAIMTFGITPAMAQSGEKEGRRVYDKRINNSSSVFVGATANSGTSVGTPLYVSPQNSYSSGGGGPLSVNQLLKSTANPTNGNSSLYSRNGFSPYGTSKSEQYALGISPDEVRRRQEARRKEEEERKKSLAEKMRNNQSAYKSPETKAERYRSAFQNKTNNKRSSSRSKPKIFVTDRSTVQTPRRTFGNVN